LRDPVFGRLLPAGFRGIGAEGAMTGCNAAKVMRGLGASIALLAMSSAAGAEGFGDMFDIAFGAAVTNDYVYRGISQTDGNPAIQGYLEFDYGMFYAGVWASNVDFYTPDTEIDTSIGIRPELDSAAFDLGYVHSHVRRFKMQA
jgi:uncharacterized protein (TIGR02001 family)